MSEWNQSEGPEIQLVEKQDGELTLYIGDAQAMQGWERALMNESADILCTYGSQFLEVGLGLGISALRIAGNPKVRRHTVVEKYRRVIDLFLERHSSVPPALQIVEADFFEYVYSLEPASLDGIFFDPYLVNLSLWRDPALWDAVVPLLVRSLRPGGVFIPCFSTTPELRWQFVNFFDRIVVERRNYATYPDTDYTPGVTGSAYIQCFINN